jgi:hypothetical protein
MSTRAFVTGLAQRRRALLGVGVTGVVVAIAGCSVLDTEQVQPSLAAARTGLTVTSTAGPGSVQPGGTLTGSIEVANEGSQLRRLADVVFAAPTSDACDRTGLVLAPTVPPTPESPLEVPAGGRATLGWTAYMDGEGDQACQGATLTSDVVLDGEPAGTVTLTAGTLEQPPAPTGGLTTSTRAAVHWSASTAADPGWVVERAVAGTADWRPACGSSTAGPVRALACTDTGLTTGTAYLYRVTLRTGHWHATSRPSRPVTTQRRP